MANTIDAGAMIAFIRDENGADVVAEALMADENLCYAHHVNLTEVYYVIAREEDEDTAEEAIRTLLDAGIIPYGQLGIPFCFEVARLRARAQADRLPISLADCFLIATSRQLQAQILTTDHGEFDPILPFGLCDVRFIR